MFTQKTATKKCFDLIGQDKKNSLKESNLPEIKQLLDYLSEQYYNNDTELVSDAQYDQLFALAHKHSKAQAKVGASVLKEFSKSKHKQAMLSLKNTYSVEESIDFHNKLYIDLNKKNNNLKNNFSYIVEKKLDGLAVSIVYKNGILSQAITRGDGFIGENVLENIRMTQNLSLKIQSKSSKTVVPEYLELRGEIVVSKKNFLKINQSQQKQEEKEFSTSRHLASSALRQKNIQVTKDRKIDFFAHSIGSVQFKSKEQIQSQNDFYKLMTDLSIPYIKKYHKMKASEFSKKLKNIYQEEEKNREAFLYDIDGLVIKLDSVMLRKSLGQTSHHPRWAVALKLKAVTAETKILDIIIQVGRTGALTPVALMQAVDVGGVCVKQASLHNQEEINRKDIRIGDIVSIQRAGDVIPKVIEVHFDKRKTKLKKFKTPKHCPSCRHLIKISKEDKVQRCHNLYCPAIIQEKFAHFVSKKALNIDKLGYQWIEVLIKEKLIKNFSDIFLLNKKHLLSLPRMAEKSSSNILKSIAQSKTVHLDKLIYALGIRFVGQQTAITLAKHCKDFGTFIKLGQRNKEQIVQELLDLEDIGDTVANCLAIYLTNKKNHPELNRLKKLNIINFQLNTNAAHLLYNKTCVVTGSLPIERSQLKIQLESLGAKVSFSISKKTDFLIAGQEAGSKLTKAKALNINILSWSKLQDIL